MGSACSNPTNNDIERSRISKNQNTRHDSAPKTLIQKSPSTSSKDVASSIHLNKPGSNSFNQMPESYSDSKIKDIEVFQKIISQAEKNLINIAQSPGYSNFSEKSPLMNVNNNILMGELCRDEVFGICNFDDQTNLKQKFSESGIDEKELKFVNNISKLILDSYSSMKVQETGIGPLFISLPDVSEIE
eukprot:gene3861-7021_t